MWFSVAIWLGIAVGTADGARLSSWTLRSKICEEAGDATLGDDESTRRAGEVGALIPAAGAGLVDLACAGYVDERPDSPDLSSFFSSFFLPNGHSFFLSELFSPSAVALSSTETVGSVEVRAGSAPVE